MGASVLHSEAVFPVRSNNIPIEIKNTFAPEKKGTRIEPREDYDAGGDKIITGIAGKKDFTVLFIEKQNMNSELGFCRKALSVLEYFGVSVEHIPTGIDTMSVVCASGEVSGKLDAILERLKTTTNADGITVYEGMALIALVGHGMKYRIGTAERMCGALARAGINIRMLDQGSSEINIILGVENGDYEKSIKALYGEFL
jgi:aspartate kinase